MAPKTSRENGAAGYTGFEEHCSPGSGTKRQPNLHLVQAAGESIIVMWWL